MHGSPHIRLISMFMWDGGTLSTVNSMKPLHGSTLNLTKLNIFLFILRIDLQSNDSGTCEYSFNTHDYYVCVLRVCSMFHYFIQT